MVPANNAAATAEKPTRVGLKPTAQIPYPPNASPIVQPANKAAIQITTPATILVELIAPTPAPLGPVTFSGELIKWFAHLLELLLLLLINNHVVVRISSAAKLAKHVAKSPAELVFDAVDMSQAKDDIRSG